MHMGHGGPQAILTLHAQSPKHKTTGGEQMVLQGLGWLLVPQTHAGVPCPHLTQVTEGGALVDEGLVSRPPGS